ncbi:CoA transferase [Halorubellus sp. JP-L1]|nr:CoA transferase [Halorubellus sp. JP-L1]NHN42806.1 CoA transferase [Halorubellus sp. JP-L1]
MDPPLKDVRILDLGQIYQGGYCGMVLAYLGADVVKVEPPWGENVRTRTEDGKPPQYQYLNPNKRGITINLKSERGKGLLKELAAEADVIFENYATGKMDELGVGYETLEEINPELIYAHGSGYGDTGPYAEYPAMDLTVQAMSGIMSTTGFPEQPPVKAGPAVADFFGAIHLVAGIVSALFQRERTGSGQYVEVGMFDTIYPTLASPVASWVSETETPPRTGNQHSGLSIAPYNAYEVDDGHVTIICIAERHWESLARLMGHKDLLGVDRLSSKAKRAEHIGEVDGYIKEWLDGMEKDEVTERLREAGVPCAPVRTIEEIVADDHLEERGMLNHLPNQSDGRSEVPVPGLPIKFSGSEQPDVESAPLLSEHTEEVLADLLDYDDELIDALDEEGVI